MKNSLTGWINYPSRTLRKISLKRKFGWSSLRGMGESSIVKLTALIPVIGYLILFNDKFVELLALSEHLIAAQYFIDWFGRENATAESLSSWRLYMIYFGLLSVGLATMIYNFGCPKLIKEYRSANAYTAETAPLITGFIRVKLLDDLEQFSYRSKDLGGLIHQMSKENQNIRDLNQKTLAPHQLSEPVERADDLNKNMLHQIWFEYNTDNILGLYSALVFYVCGFLILSLPAIDTFIAVFRAFIAS